MSIIAASNSIVSLGQAGQIHAPQENIAQFKALLNNVERALRESQTNLNAAEDKGTDGKMNLIEDTALRVSKSEKAIERLETDLRKGSSDLRGDVSTDSNYVQNIARQQFTTAYYFVGINRVESSASNFSEELTSVTKGR